MSNELMTSELMSEDLRAGEAVDGVGGHLESQLPAVVDRVLKGILLLLHQLLGVLARRQQLLEDLKRTETDRNGRNG